MVVRCNYIVIFTRDITLYYFLYQQNYNVQYEIVAVLNVYSLLKMATSPFDVKVL